MGGFLVVLAYGVDGFLDHLAQHTALDGHGVVGAGHRQAGVVAGIQGRNFKFCHTTADFCLAFVVQLNADIACGHTIDHGAEQFCIQHSFTGYKYVAFNGSRDAHFHIVAGQGQVKALGFHVDAFQHRDGRAVGDCAGDAVNGTGKQGLFAFKFHGFFSFRLFWKKASAKNVKFTLQFV